MMRKMTRKTNDYMRHLSDLAPYLSLHENLVHRFDNESTMTSTLAS